MRFFVRLRISLDGNRIYLLYAVQGLSNKEIAEKLNVSVETMGKHYSELYAALNVKNKAGLVELHQMPSRKPEAPM